MTTKPFVCVCVDSELWQCVLREAGPSIIRGMSMIRLVVSDRYRSLYVGEGNEKGKMTNIKLVGFHV